ncbi:MAG: undecaprenyldiphospho-muramoylpentapeptide beta-N-acetylglucosaminyltransferase [Methanobacterium sp.]|nr:undecaprenyldiphospho-muramoylpentapeptide beta-N-acetylglucosaminyltransferase [Methanobacterium sp.]
MKVAFTGGGTAGHAMVNKVLIPLLHEDEYKIIYIGSYNGAEKAMIENQGIADYYGISTGKLRRYFSWDNVKDLFKVLKGVFQAYRILRKEMPNVLFSGGGFVSVPVIIAAHFLKIPILIRETDFSIGLANRICIPFAQKVFVTFPDTKLKVNTVPCDYCGLIIRPELLDTKHSATKSERPTVLVMGGSLGSQSINQVIWNNADNLLCRYNILHICGKGKINRQLQSNEKYRQYEYVEDMADLYSRADVIITRCGSNAISEGLALGKPMVCIPLPSRSSRGEQKQNALYAVQNGCATIIEENELCYETLVTAIEEVLKKPINPKLVLNKERLMCNCRKLITEIKSQAMKNLEERFIKLIEKGRSIDYNSLSEWEFKVFLELDDQHGKSF